METIKTCTFCGKTECLQEFKKGRFKYFINKDGHHWIGNKCWDCRKKRAANFCCIYYVKCSECSKIFISKIGQSNRFVRCKSCKREAERQRAQRNRKPAQPCITCGNPSKFSSKYCGDCLQKNKNNKPKKQCKVCNKELKNNYLTYCSECKPTPATYKSANAGKPCQLCGEPLPKGKRLFCSHKCANKSMRQAHKEQRKAYKKLRQRSETKAKLAYCTWAEVEEYYKNRPDNHHVDHIIPLNHPDVCGLHIICNFQYLSEEDNVRKSNQFDGTFENESWKS